MPGSASGGMDGVAVKPLTVDFHEGGFQAKLNQENRLGFWFQLSDKDRQQADSPWGPANPQALNRYSYVQNNPLRWTDPTGHCPMCAAAVGWALSAAGIVVTAPAAVVVAALAAVFTVSALAVFLSDAGNRDWLADQISSGIDDIGKFYKDLPHILESKFKGGSQNSRDRDFGIKDKDFWQWWHRGGGKESYGGQNIGSKDEADAVYDDWVKQGKPRGSKSNK